MTVTSLNVTVSRQHADKKRRIDQIQFTDPEFGIFIRRSLSADLYLEHDVIYFLAIASYKAIHLFRGHVYG